MSFSLSSDMGTLCSDHQQVQQHKFHPSHQLYFNKKSLREIDIPPRKLLSRRAAAASGGVLHLDSDMVMDSPKGGFDEALLQKFLPYNKINDEDDDDDDDDDVDPYSSDHFRMYEFKVRKCTRSRSHDWTDCPFAHPGEKARRRDPRRYHYTGTVCAEFRRGSCSRGDNCEFAHGVFECWLHPSRYRTEACKDGKNCKRKVCFFAHTPRQLRVLPANFLENASSPVNSPVALEKKHRNVNHCCVYCHTVAVSPTSTLMGMSHLSPPMSPSLSPPLSPVKTAPRFSPVSRYKDHFVNMEACRYPQFNSSPLSYKDALTELMSSLEAMQVNESSSSHHSGNLQWLDVNFNGDDQHQFILSPSTPSPGSSKFLHGNFPTKNSTEEYKYNDNGLAGPDLGWVNDLLT